MKVFKRALAGLLIAVMLVPEGITAFAAADPGNVGNGTTANGDSQGNDGFTNLGDHRPFTNYIDGSNGDAWEISVYAESIGVKGASFMMYGDATNQELTGAPIRMMDWGDSNGEKHSTNRTGRQLKQYNPESPVWSNQSAIVGWAQTDGQLDGYIFAKLKEQGEINQSQYEVLYDTAKFITSGEDLSDEELQERLAAGELVDFTIAMEPILPYKFRNVSALPGGITVGNTTYDLDKRQELYSNWFAIIGANGLGNMLAWLSNPFISFDVEAGAHNCHHDWRDINTRWDAYNPTWTVCARDNYYTFVPNFEGQQAPTDPPAPPPNVPTDDGFPEIRIKEKEMLANIITKWCEDDPEGNRFAGTLKEIRIQEKNFDLPGKGIHDVESGSECTKKVGDPPEKCGTTKERAIYCDQQYDIEWTPNPTIQFDEEDLKSEANITGQSTDEAAGWPGVDIVNQYQMTRKDGIMDLEFCDPGNIFDIYTFNNASPSPSTTLGPTGESNYYANPGWATPVGESEPFRTCFRVSFNSHRFSKWVSDDPLSVAGGVEKFIPLAWYMMDTQENIKYEDFMDERGLVKRIEGELDEKDSSNMDAMYGGHPGKNLTWGHGGDYGTETADSDVLWNNMWSWVRTLHYPAGTSGYECPSCDDGYEVNHPGCDLPTAESGYSAENIHTPRAVFARTLVVEDTLHGEARENMAPELSYFMRENEYANDRVSFFIPSTIFEFSPTYKMFADYDLNCTGDDYEDIWCLASDVDKVQFIDVLDVNLIGGETNVRAPWSRDYEDQNATDPNTGEPINVVKGGSAYHVDTTTSRVELTAVVHYYDLSFFEPGTPEYQRAEHANKIVAAYTDAINKILNSINDGSFGYYTNLVGGTTYSSKYREWGSAMNPQIFNGAPYMNKDGLEMILPDPMDEYPKLQLTPNVVNGYVNGNRSITAAHTVLNNHRLNGYFDIFDAEKSKGSELWTDQVLHEYIPDINIQSNERLQKVLERGKGTNEPWYTEDFEGIKVCVIKGWIDLPAIRSNPATVYERLSDFRSSVNTWSPQMLHPIIEADGGTGLRGDGDLVVIEDGSVGAGTYLDIPPTTIYPGGVDSPLSLSKWSISYKPDLFGVRGSVFDLS